MAHLRGGRGSVAIGYGRVGNYVKVHPLALFTPNDPEQSPSAKKQVRSRKELSGRFVGFDDHTGLVDNGKTPVYLGKSCGVVLANLSTAAILAYLTSRNRQGILGSLVSGVRPTSSDVPLDVRNHFAWEEQRRRKGCSQSYPQVWMDLWITLCRWEDLRWHKLNMHPTPGVGFKICSGMGCRIPTGTHGSPG